MIFVSREAYLICWCTHSILHNVELTWLFKYSFLAQSHLACFVSQKVVNVLATNRLLVVALTYNSTNYMVCHRKHMQ